MATRGTARSPYPSRALSAEATLLTPPGRVPLLKSLTASPGVISHEKKRSGHRSDPCPVTYLD